MHSENVNSVAAMHPRLDNVATNDNVDTLPSQLNSVQLQICMTHGTQGIKARKTQIHFGSTLCRG